MKLSKNLLLLLMCMLVSLMLYNCGTNVGKKSGDGDTTSGQETDGKDYDSTGAEAASFNPPNLTSDVDYDSRFKNLGDLGFGEEITGEFPQGEEYLAFQFDSEDETYLDFILTKLEENSNLLPALVIYGPQNDIGAWGTPIAAKMADPKKDSDSVRVEDFPINTPGNYMVMLTALEKEVEKEDSTDNAKQPLKLKKSWKFKLLLNCSGKCRRPKPYCPKFSCNKICLYGFKSDDMGCRLCQCEEKVECKPDDKECQENCICPDISAPICGDDNKTYPNKCIAGCYEVKISHEGECKTVECADDKDCRQNEQCQKGHCQYYNPNCVCTKEYRPVCGKDGQTYGNECLAKCAEVETGYPGKCKENDRCSDQTCPPLQCPTGMASMLADGECCPVCVPRSCVCPKLWEPVCGVDGNTYPNKCEAECKHIKVAAPGPCKPDCSQVKCPVTECKPEEKEVMEDNGCCRKCIPSTENCICPMIYAPVCGVDNQSYENECQAKCKGVQVAYKGKCGQDSCKNVVCKEIQCPAGQKSVIPAGKCCPVCLADQACNCPRTWDPVCGVDGRTYSNECEAKCQGIKVSYHGKCKPDCTRVNCLPVRCEPGQVHEIPEGDCCEICISDQKPCACPLYYKPVCGKDGKTYANDCAAKCEKVEIDYPGKCKEDCKDIKCAKLTCKTGYEASLATGDCCPKCFPVNPTGCVCPNYYKPVCGENGKTYANDCEAKCAKVIFKPGPCPLDCKLVRCKSVACAPGFTPKIPQGKCCPICEPDKEKLCGGPDNKECEKGMTCKKITNMLNGWGLCRMDCGLVDCQERKCASGYLYQVPPDKCCGVCIPDPNGGAFCGGIAGIQCPTGMECVLDNNHPDAGGRCVPKGSDECGGNTGQKCASGYVCHTPFNCPGCPGKCAKEIKCGGANQIKCPEGFECISPFSYPDPDGVCYPKKPCPPQCDLYCPHGYVKDADGCSTCKCNEPPSNCPEITCKMYCQYGFKKDARGCEICECNPKPKCPEIACTLYCRYGYVTDSNNCPVCKCREPEEIKCGGLTGKRCPEGYTCKYDDANCSDCFGKCIKKPVLECDQNKPCPSTHYCLRDAAGYSKCVERPNQTGCSQNSECQPGYFCINLPTNTGITAGKCLLPKEIKCDTYQNVDCPKGFACYKDQCFSEAGGQICHENNPCPTGFRCEMPRCGSASSSTTDSDNSNTSTDTRCVGVPGRCVRQCLVSGCNSEICSEKKIMTTCQYLPEYKCLRLSKCQVKTDGKCGWSVTPDFKKCLDDLKQKPECKPTGCGNICSDREIKLTCQPLPEYACYAKANCMRNQQGYCAWDYTEDYKKCRADLNKCNTNQDCQTGYICRNGNCEKQVRYCTREYRPVCGKDGKTYPNPCSLKYAGIELDYYGTCKNYSGCKSDSECKQGYICELPKCSDSTKCQGEAGVCVLAPPKCMRTGCSKELCADKPMMSTCMYKKEYYCYQYRECKETNGSCSWQDTETYKNCLQKLTNR